MNTRQSNCANSHQLGRLLNEQLSREEENMLLQHLETCSACQSLLESTAGDVHFWRDLKEHLSERIRLHRDSDVEETPQATSIENASIEYLLQQLTPSDFPDSLGRIGNYEVRGVVGRGGTGIVLKAFEPSLNRYVAIKLLSPSLASNTVARGRFEQEGRAIAAVVHEHVAEIFAVDEFRSLPYIVMQYVSGGNLQNRIDNHWPLTVVEIVRIATQVAGGLAAAHEQGIVHRDIKPANILLDHGIDRALVSDFGLARVADSSSYTMSGVIAGTPSYMAPEQVNGTPIDERTDLFSFGSVMHAMCTGQPPFHSETVYGILRRICEDDPRPIREVNSDVPRWLETFITKLMSKEPGQRFESAAFVSQLLKEELAHLQGPTSVKVPERTWDDSRFVQAGLRFNPKTTLYVVVGTVAVLGSYAAFLASNQVNSSNSNNPQNASAEGTQKVPTESAAPLTTDFELSEEHTFPVKAGGQLVLDAGAGHVEISTSSEKQVRCLLIRKVVATDEEAARKMAALHRVSFTAEDGDVVVKTKMDAALRRTAASSPRVNTTFRITVPRNYNPTIASGGGRITLNDPIVGDVHLTSSGGDVTLANIDGSVRADTAGGRLIAKDVTGGVDFNSGGGNVTINYIAGRTDIDTGGANVHIIGIKGRADIYSGGGSISLGPVSDSISVETAGGSISVDSIEGVVRIKTSGGNVSVKLSEQLQRNCHVITSGGDVRIRLARGTALNVDAETASGEVIAPFFGQRQRKVVTKLNGGGPTLEARTDRGNVVFEYLP